MGSRMNTDSLQQQINNLNNAIKGGRTRVIKKIVDLFHRDVVRNKQLLSELYINDGGCETQDDLILTACTYNRAKILCYLINESNILNYLTNPSCDDAKISTQRTEAIRKALRLGAFDMVEMLYDYWSGDMHCLGDDINNINSLGKLFENIRTTDLVEDQSTMVNYHCLIKFNCFQQTLYTSLQKHWSTTKSSDNTDIKPEQIGAMLLTVLQVYEEYSCLEKVRIPHEVSEVEQHLRADLDDKTDLYSRGLAHIMYEVYFRKINFNVSLLIMEKLGFLKNHLKERFNKTKAYFDLNPELYSGYKHAAQLYEQIQCMIYQFVLRTNKDWRFKLPENRNTLLEKKCLGVKGQIITAKYNPLKLYKGPVIILVENSFKSGLENLKNIIIDYVISKDLTPVEIGDNSPVVTLIDDNCMEQIKYINDYNALREIIYYIEATEGTNVNKTIMIERVIQLIEDILKSGVDPSHLSQCTKALLRVFIPVETINRLYDLKEYFSKTSEGQMSSGVNIENSQNYTFHKVMEDLTEIINSILGICEANLEKTFLQNALCLLDKRINDLPDKVRPLVSDICKLYQTHGNALFSASNIFIKEVWVHTECTIQLLKEIIWILRNKDELISELKIISGHVSNDLVIILPKYIKNVKRTLELTTMTLHADILLINKQLLECSVKPLPDQPNIMDIANVIRETEERFKHNGNKNVDLDKLQQIKDFSIYWKCTKEFLEFMLQNCEIYAQLHLDFVLQDCTPDMQAITNVFNLLTNMEEDISAPKCTPVDSLLENARNRFYFRINRFLRTA